VNTCQVISPLFLNQELVVLPKYDYLMISIVSVLV